MKFYFKIFLGIVLLGIFVWTFYFLYAKSKPVPEVFETETPFTADIAKKTSATGTVGPEKEVDIKSIVSGIVEKIYVEAGHHVKSGDFIAKVRLIPNMVNLSNAENRQRKAEIAMQDAQRIHERQEKLLHDKVISASEYELAHLAYNNAKEELNAAEDNLQLVREGVSKKSGTVSNTLIKSTIDGMVLDVPIKEGKTVIEANTFNEGTTIASIADMDRIIFNGKIDESEVGKVKKGMPVLISIGAIEGEVFHGELEYISPKGKTVDKDGKGAIQFEIRARLKLKENQVLRAGYSASAEIVLEEKKQTLALHERLVQFSHDSSFVEVETKPNEFKKRLVKLGLSDGLNVEILSGLQKGEKVKVKK